MTAYIYSSSYASCKFNIYKPKLPNDLGTPRVLAKSIHINGGAGVAHRRKQDMKNFDPSNIAPILVTPNALVTSVTDEDFELLLKNKNFMKAVAKKHLSYDKKHVDAEKKISSGEILEKDKKGPLTKASLAPDAKNNPSDDRLKAKEEKFQHNTAVEIK